MFSIETLISKTLKPILIFGTIFLLGQFFFTLSFPESSYNFLGKDKRVELEPGKTVTQRFQSTQNGLDRIKIRMGDIGSIGLRDTIKLSLLEADCHAEIARQTISFLTPEPNIYFHFNFQRIPDSREKTYCLGIRYDSPKKKKERPFIAASDDETFSGSSYFDEGKSRFFEGRSLQIRPSYSEPSFFQNIQELEHRLSQYKPVFLKGSILVIGIASIFLSTIFGIFLLRFKDDNGSRPTSESQS